MYIYLVTKQSYLGASMQVWISKYPQDPAVQASTQPKREDNNTYV
jgi:hypothetical protein